MVLQRVEVRWRGLEVVDFLVADCAWVGRCVGAVREGLLGSHFGLIVGLVCVFGDCILERIFLRESGLIV